MKRRTIIISLILVTVLGLVIIRLAHNKELIDAQTSYMEVIKDVPVRVQSAKVRSINSELRFVGNFLASKEAPLSAEIPGTIVKTLVNEGDFVRGGQIIAEIDLSLLVLKLEADQVKFEHSSEDLARYENLNKHDATSDVVLKQMRLTNSLDEIALRNTKEQIDKSKIKAPIAGYLTSKLFEVGSVVSPGVYIGQVINTNILKFTAMVPEYQVVELQKNQKVTVQADVFQETTYPGVISQISEKGDVNHNFKVEVTVSNNKKSILKAGMNGLMIVNSASSVEGIFVPRDALQGDLSSPMLYLAVQNMAVLKNVVTGMSIENEVQILEGVHDGDQIITTGMSNLKDSTTIKIANNKIEQ